MTYNRGKLLRLAKAGKLTAVESYHFDDMSGSERMTGREFPVRLHDGLDDFKEGFYNLYTSDFKSKSGMAWLNPNGSVTLIVHSNCNYTFKIIDPSRREPVGLDIGPVL